MRLDRIRARHLGHVALTAVAGQPAPLLLKKRHLAVVEHDGKAVLVDGGLRARLDLFVQLRIAVLRPPLTIEAQVGVGAPGEVVLGFPLEAPVKVLGVIGGLDVDVDRALLAIELGRLRDNLTGDSFIAHVGFLALVAGETGLALGDHRRTGMCWATQPLKGRLGRIKECYRLCGHLGPVARCSGERCCLQACGKNGRPSHDYRSSHEGFHDEPPLLSLQPLRIFLNHLAGPRQSVIDSNQRGDNHPTLKTEVGAERSCLQLLTCRAKNQAILPSGRMSA